MEEEDLQLVQRHVERFNDGVRSGDFRAMFAGFTEDAELIFEGVPVGPFLGRQAIAAAYDERPPDDQIIVSEPSAKGGELVVRYAWASDPEVTAGEMRLVRTGGRISRLVVTFDEAGSGG